MAQVSLSIGSNQNAEFYILKALDALRHRYGELIISSVYESQAVGFTGGNFLNLVVLLNTQESLQELAHFLKHLESENGRIQGQPRFSARTLDVDILTYDDLQGVFEGITLPREEITENAYVLCPLAEVNGDWIHPLHQLTLKSLWLEYDKSRQNLWPVDFFWHSRQISRAQTSSSA